MNIWSILWTISTPLVLSSALVFLLRTWISVRLKKSIEHEYNEKLEAFKTQQQGELERLSKLLEKKNYVSKIRFDAEFQIYQELSKAFFGVILTQSDLFTFYRFDNIPQDRAKQKELYQMRFEEARNAYNPAMNCLHRNAPFIEKKLYDKFCALLNDVKLQLIFYPDYYIGDNYQEYRREDKETFEECSQRTKTINENMDVLFSELRDYLKSLDVVT